IPNLVGGAEGPVGLQILLPEGKPGSRNPSPTRRANLLADVFAGSAHVQERQLGLAQITEQLLDPNPHPLPWRSRPKGPAWRRNRSGRDRLPRGPPLLDSPVQDLD